MEALVITLREGIEAALVLGIILAYLRKIGRMALSRQVYAGLGLAIVASIVVALIFQLIGLDPNNNYVEGIMMGVAGIFVAGMVFWMWRTAKSHKQEMEARLKELTTVPSGKTSGFGLLLFTFFMVLREGVEMVIFLWATALGEEASILKFIGGAVGLGLAALFAVLFIRGSVRINLSRFFGVTGLVLLVLAARLLIGSVNEFGEIGVLPLNEGTMAVLGYLVRDSSTTAILMALIAVPIFLLLWESFQQKPKVAPVSDGSVAEHRKQLASVRLERAWQVGLAVATLLILLALGRTMFASGEPTNLPVGVVAPLAGSMSFAELGGGTLVSLTAPAHGGIVWVE